MTGTKKRGGAARRAAPPKRSTRDRLLDVGLAMLLEHGYHGLGVQPLLDAARAPKGSFYHHFADKESFALAVIDRYMQGVHGALDECLGNHARPPLDRVRGFFDLTREAYRKDGYLGCLLGGLGQELSGTSDLFRQKIESCLSALAGRIAGCLDEAKERGEIPAGADTRRVASLLVDCWEGAALRSRLQADPTPLTAMLDFFFQTANCPTPPAAAHLSHSGRG